MIHMNHVTPLWLMFSGEGGVVEIHAKLPTPDQHMRWILVEPSLEFKITMCGSSTLPTIFPRVVLHIMKKMGPTRKDNMGTPPRVEGAGDLADR